VSAHVYILRCADGSYYVGVTRDGLDRRTGEHQAGRFDGDTARRRLVTLVFQQQFPRVEDAIAAERQIKGWRREKKEALIRGDYSALIGLARRRRVASTASLDQRCAPFETRPSGAPQGEELS
jgi:putative endonuclease